MVALVKAGQPIRFEVELGQGGHPVAAQSVIVSLRRLDGSVTWNASVATAGLSVYEFIVPGEFTGTLQVREFATVELAYYDDLNNHFTSAEIDLVIASGTSLVAGLNSFAGFPDLFLASYDLVDLSAFKLSDKEQQITALVNAYYNIAKLRLEFSTPDTLASAGVISSSTLTALDLLSLTPQDRARLLHAQLIEADFLLGGDPIEMQRRTGLLSHAAGESTHFYRTSKPLELPVSRKTAEALRGLITYAIRTGR